MRKRKQQLPSRDRLSQIFTHDITTGLFTWKIRTSNRVNVGDIAGYIDLIGRRVIRIDSELYYAYVLVWIWCSDEPVPDEIDHIDMNKGNDAFNNLRAATRQQSSYNKGVRPDSGTGVKGVEYEASRNKYKPYIKDAVTGKKIHLGRYDTLEEAKKVREAAAEKMHGEFVRHR